jgi:hypothetical protein
MFSITIIPPAIDSLISELELLIDRIAKEPPRRDEATREIDMTPELMDLNKLAGR